MSRKQKKQKTTSFNNNKPLEQVSTRRASESAEISQGISGAYSREKRRLRGISGEFSPIGYLSHDSMQSSLLSTIASLEAIATEEDAETLSYMRELAAGEIPAGLPPNIYIRTAIGEMALCKFLRIEFRERPDASVDISVGGTSLGVRVVDRPEDPLRLENLSDFQTDILVVACLHSSQAVELVGWVDLQHFAEHSEMNPTSQHGSVALGSKHLKSMDRLLSYVKKVRRPA